MKKIFFFCAFIFGFLFLSQAQENQEIWGYDLEGNKLNKTIKKIVFETYNKPKIVVVTAVTWCPPCKKQLKEILVPLYEDYKDFFNFYVIEVDTKTSTPNSFFFERWRKTVYDFRYPWAYRNNIGANWKDISELKLVGGNIPIVNFINKDGKILHQQEGFQPGHNESWRELFEKVKESIENEQ